MSDQWIAVKAGNWAFKRQGVKFSSSGVTEAGVVCVCIGGVGVGGVQIVSVLLCCW